METLLLDPQTEPKVEAPVARAHPVRYLIPVPTSYRESSLEAPAPPERPVRSAAGRTPVGAPSWNDELEIPNASPEEAPPRALSSGADQTQVYPCPGRGWTLATIILSGAALTWSVTLLLLGVGGEDWFMFAFATIILLAAVANALRRPYQILIGRDWAEFVSLIETQRVHRRDVLEIVRHEPESQPGHLSYLVVQLTSGSVRPRTSDEDIFKALTRFNSAALVTTETYDDSD